MNVGLLQVLASRWVRSTPESATCNFASWLKPAVTRLIGSGE
jgi:hypothetical protein